MSNQLVVIDPHVANYQSLIDQLEAAYSYLLLMSDSDGVTQISNYVAANPGFDAIHLISHGSPGQVAVGTATLSEGTIGRYTAQLNQIGASLNPGGDLLIYGCGVAQGDAGLQLISDLSRLTRLDVAASTNKTGGTGDWVLEEGIGRIQTALPSLTYDLGLGVSGPALAWTRLIGSTGSDRSYAVSIGLDGSVYIAGTTFSATFDGQPVAGTTDAFVSKYADDGTRAWTKLIGSTGNDFADALTIGLDGAIYVAGSTYSASLDGQANAGSNDAFLTKFAPGGKKVWTKLIGSTGGEDANAITVDDEGSLYFSGKTASPILEGQNNAGGDDAFLTKFSADGTKLWTRLIGSTGQEEANALATGEDNSIYVSGKTSSSSLDGQINAGGGDAFLTKFSADGTKLWTRLIGSTGSEYSDALTAGLDGSIYVAGNSDSATLLEQTNAGSFDSFISKYSADGTRIWTRFTGSNEFDYAAALTTGQDGSIFLAGSTNSATLDDQTSSAAGNAFVVKYATDGTRVWTKLIGSTQGLNGGTGGRALAAGFDDSLYLSGDTGSPMLNGQPNSGSTDAFVLKIIDANVTPPTIAVNCNRLSLAIGQTATLSFTISESVSDFVVSDITVSGGTLSNFSGSGTNYAATFTPTANSKVSGVVSVASNKFSDAAGNFNVDGADANNTVTMAVSTVVGPNDKPTAASSTLTTLEDSELAFTKDNFPFKDSDPSDSLQAISITVMPTKGALKLNGVSVSVNQIIPVADVVAGKLAFTPVADANGKAHARVGFKVSDGKDFSTSAYNLTVNVTAVNDAPTVAKPVTTPLSLIEGKAFSFSLPSGTFKDVDDKVLTYSATGLPNGISVDPKTGRLSGTPGYDAADIASRIITIKATDTGGLSASMPLSMNVTNTPKILGTSAANNIAAGLGNDSMSGGAGDDTLSGGVGNDTLVGGPGNDVLTGGDGVDRFVFDVSLANPDIDTIKDFVTGTDKIVLSAKVFSKFTGSSVGSAVTAGNLVVGAGATAVAKDNDDYLIYDTTSDLLYYDADGSGSGAPLAFVKIELTGTAAPALGDFLVVS
jgi:Ca2+-binding RTX toxin-like protein